MGEKKKKVKGSVNNQNTSKRKKIAISLFIIEKYIKAFVFNLINKLFVVKIPIFSQDLGTRTHSYSP